METKETTIIDVKLDAGKVAEDLQDIARQIVNVKNEQKQLDEEYKAGKLSATEYAKATAAMKDELSWLQKQQKGVIATQKLLTATSDTYSDSLNGQRQKLADMQKAYDQLDKATRESKSGKAFLKQIQEQSEAVKKMEQDTGRAQRSVGNYKGALEEAGIGIGAFTKKMLLFLKNPWVLTIGAIVAVFKKLIGAFKGSEDRMNEMRKALAPLKAVGDMVTKVFDGLAKTLGNLVSGALAKLTEGVSWLFKAIDKLGKKMGKDWGLSEAFETAAANTKKATEATEQYDKARRALVVTEAKTEKEIADLRAKAADKEKYTAAERIAMLEQAKDKELALAAEQKRVAQLHLTALQAEAANTENAKEVNDELAEARAAVIRTETAYLNMERSLNKQISAFRREEMSDAEKATKENEKREKEADKATKASLDYRLQVQMAALGKNAEYSQKAYEIQMAYYKDVLALYEAESAEYYNTLKAKEKYDEDYQNKRIELRQSAEEFMSAYNDRESIDNEYQQQLTLLEEYHRQGILSEEEYEATKTKIANEYAKQRTKAITAELGALSNSFDAMADMLGEFAGENAEAAAAQKIFAFSSILFSEAQSIAQGALALSEGVASAAAIPFPGNIPAILSIVTTITSLIAGVGSSIVQAKQIFAKADNDAGNFSHGGTIEGTSYTGDKLIAHVNSGEGIYTGTQANNLLQDIANNPLHGANYDAMAAAMAAAVAAQPAPVMVLQEFREFEQKVSTYNEIAKV